jgi:hypothetical protein
MESVRGTSTRTKKCIVGVITILIMIGLVIFVSVESELVAYWAVGGVDWVKENPAEGFTILAITYVFGVALMLPAVMWTFIIAYVAF